MNARDARGDFKLSRSMNVREEMYWMNLTQEEYLAIQENQSKGTEVSELPAFVSSEEDIRQEVRDEYLGYSSISRQRTRVVPDSVTDGVLDRPILKREKTISGTDTMQSIDLSALIEQATEMPPECWTDDLFKQYQERCRIESATNPFRLQRQKVECIPSPLFRESTQEEDEEGGECK